MLSSNGCPFTEHELDELRALRRGVIDVNSGTETEDNDEEE